MRWGAKRVLCPALLLCAVGCATGTAQDNTWQDTYTTDTVGDHADVDSPWDTVDSPTDTVLDPYGDAVPDPLVDSSDDVPFDTADGSDLPTDTAVDDVAVDEAPPTCTPADLVTQAMCGAGYKCTFTSLNASGTPETFCDIEGAQGWNESCGAGGTSDNCQAGYMCLSSGSGDSRCRMFCSLDSQCQTYPGGTNGACEIGVSVGGVEAIGVTTCSFHCDVLNQIGCDAGQGCRAAFPGDYTYWSDCTMASSGSGCVAGTGSDCAAGWDCFSIDSDGDTVSDYNECLEYCSYPYGYCASGTCSQGTGWPSTIGVCF